MVPSACCTIASAVSIICCVHKYRYRAGNKVGEDKETDLRKSDWYAKMAQSIRDDYSLNV